MSMMRLTRKKSSAIINDANAIAEDALGKFFEEKKVKNITFDITWDGDSTVEEGTLHQEIGLAPKETANGSEKNV